ncbi:MAG: hypothetical protein HY782_21250 [Chloroflexi bacterium]|nr:hypothetical protein [Chloroflexota bacterium]
MNANRRPIPDLTKQLVVNRLAFRHRMEGKYLLGLTEQTGWREQESTLSLTADDMVRFGLDPSEDLVGATVELTLKPIPYSPETHSPHTVIVKQLLQSSETHQNYFSRPQQKSEERTYRLQANTPVHGGTLVVLPSTYYELDLLLSAGEYRRLKALPADTAFEMRLRQTNRDFRDVILKRRATLDSPRVFPDGYSSRMITLARAMIAYFDGDVDYVGHYCGLEIHDREAGDESRQSTWRWHRDYFAVDSLSAKSWEKSFAKKAERADAILKERYNNRLPIGDVDTFYDHVETSTWQSKKYHPVEEMTVGLDSGSVIREHQHLPSIIVEARSTRGNRKACEAACEALCREAAGLFQVVFDHQSLDIEAIRDEPESRPQSQPRKATRRRKPRRRQNAQSF